MRKAKKIRADASDPGMPSGSPLNLIKKTRKPQDFWDRIKFLVLFVALWFILVWAMIANNPLVGVSDAFRTQVNTGYWVFILIGLELLRQIHYIICEHSARYNQFWVTMVFGKVEGVSRRRMSNWTRF